MNKKFFIIEESAIQTGKYLVKMNFSYFPNITTEGSFALLPARLMGLSYAQYCRMCRDMLGAEIVGKGSKYPKIFFKKGEKVDTLLRILNKRMEYIEKYMDNTISDDLISQWRAEYEQKFGEELRIG